MAMLLQNVSKNCVRILEENKHHQLRMFVILIDKPKREKPKSSAYTRENIAAVTDSVREAQSTSIHRRSQQLNIPETSLRGNLHKDFGIVQELNQIDLSIAFSLR